MRTEDVFFAGSEPGSHVEFGRMPKDRISCHYLACWLLDTGRSRRIYDAGELGQRRSRSRTSLLAATMYDDHIIYCYHHMTFYYKNSTHTVLQARGGETQDYSIHKILTLVYLAY